MWGGQAEAGDAERRARFYGLLAEHRPTLEAVARRLCREPEAAADLVQDTFERAWRSIGSLRDDERARAWLVRILRNAWLDQRRRRRSEVPIDDEANQLAITTPDEPSRWERVTIDDLHEAINRLGEPFRSVAVLHDVDRLTYREIAAKLDIPYNTAATRLHRAHQQIKELLRDKLEGSV